MDEFAGIKESISTWGHENILLSYFGKFNCFDFYSYSYNPYVSDMRLGFVFHFFPYGYLVSPVPFIKNILLSSLLYSTTFVIEQLAIYERVCFWTFFPIHWPSGTLHQYHTFIITMITWRNYLRIVLANNLTCLSVDVPETNWKHGSDFK